MHDTLVEDGEADDGAVPRCQIARKRRYSHQRACLGTDIAEAGSRAHAPLQRAVAAGYGERGV